MTHVIILSSIDLLIIVALVCIFLYWFFSPPNIFSITISDIPIRWSISIVLTLMAMVSIALAVSLILGIEVATIFFLTCVKVVVISIKS